MISAITYVGALSLTKNKDKLQSISPQSLIVIFFSRKMHPVLPAARRHSPSTRSQHLVQISGALNKKKRFPLFCWNVENLNKGRRKVSLVD